MNRQYKKPPLVEAVCEFRFEPGSPWDLAIPGLLYKPPLSDIFPNRKPGKAFEALVTAGPGGVQQQISQTDMAQFWKEDESALVQLSPDVLAVIHRKPYPGWLLFLPMIRQAVEAYQEVAKPNGLQRIGLRYVNQINFDQSRVELEDYFDFYPFVGERIAQDHSGFLVGINIPFDDERDILRLQMATIGEQKNAISIVLDLDYFLRIPGSITFGNVFNWLDRAHARAEEAFEGCLKAAMRERFEEASDG